LRVPPTGDHRNAMWSVDGWENGECDPNIYLGGVSIETCVLLLYPVVLLTNRLVDSVVVRTW